MRRVLVILVLVLSIVPVAHATIRAQAAPGAPVAPAAPTGGEPNTTAVGDVVQIEASFVSALGWVKPAETYPFRVLLHNSGAEVTGAQVTLDAPDGAVFMSVNRPDAAVDPAGVAWSVGTIPAGTADAPSTVTLVIEGRSKGFGEDPQIVWKDLSTSAVLTYDGGPAGGLTSTTHGPKVIPVDSNFETARYGDRPFPVVPVAYSDRQAAEAGSAALLAQKLNDPATPGSTFNLYQELSYGQLYPQADIPSLGIASTGFDDPASYGFTTVDPDTLNTCTGGLTYAEAGGAAIGTPLYENRIVDGWYQLPGNTAYYGADANGSALVGALAGVGTLQAIDSGCGPTGKLVYDAAAIADPEIDYDDYDTDKDGVVDFFMAVFTGLGGNGDSQLNGVPPYDNVWPHSSSLEFGYSDPVTGLGGYTTRDQLHDLEARPQCWLDDSYSAQGTCASAGGPGDDALPVHVRVGPYNVNPESAIEHASVISHEYGHSLGLPDFYSTGSRETYGDFTLMATDKSQGMDIFARQDLGWIVPEVLQTGSYRDLPESDTDIDTIVWETLAGEPYTLSGPDVQNGPGWMVKLPARQLISPDLIAEQASPTHVWWSESGNDFGCSPEAGHNFDLYVPELADVPAGTATTLSLKSNFDIEWDYDYGFVMVSTDGGTTFQSLESLNGYTTPATQNPNANPCQGTFGNGITGTGSSYDSGTADLDRVLGEYPAPVFVDDAFDLSSFAGQEIVLRFSYATDPGLARPGWFVDDVAIDAGGTPVYGTDFEDSGDPDDPRVFNGGCRESLGSRCTDGWQYVDASSGSPADHGYYLSLRDRSSFDLDGKGENDRDAIGFEPGVLLVYTDESHGYGNVGTSNPPAQSPLDSQPEPGSDTPDLDDATFTAADGDDHFDDQAWIDNYDDPSRDAECVADCDNPLLASSINPWLFDFGCLSFDVLSMSGDDVGPETAPGNLTSTLDVDLGEGCIPFDYGRGDGENAPPTAIAQAKSTAVAVDEDVLLDGSASFDDRSGPSDLTYAWSLSTGVQGFRGGPLQATELGDGQTLTTSFSEPGDYTVILTVTDPEGLAATDEIVITVGDGGTQPGTPNPGPSRPTRLPATGGVVAVLPAVLLASIALILRMRRRRA